MAYKRDKNESPTLCKGFRVLGQNGLKPAISAIEYIENYKNRGPRLIKKYKIFILLSIFCKYFNKINNLHFLLPLQDSVDAVFCNSPLVLSSKSLVFSHFTLTP
jgi:hypothetical protein